jgi:hypothetical protein
MVGGRVDLAREPLGLGSSSSTCETWPERSRRARLGFSNLKYEREEEQMYATHRRYEGIDQNRIEELTRKVNEGLIPRLSTLPGFKGFYLMEAGEGVVRSTSLFDTFSQAEDSTRVAAEWTQEEKLEKLVPNPPKVITRKVLAHEMKPLLVV